MRDRSTYEGKMRGDGACSIPALLVLSSDTDMLCNVW